LLPSEAATILIGEVARSVRDGPIAAPLTWRWLSERDGVGC
jgi:hypothetical protein